MQAIVKTFFVWDSIYTGDTPYWVWFDLDNSLTRWKRPIFKYTYLKLFGNNRKFPYEKLTFFLGNLYQKNLFALDFRYTGDTPYQNWFDLDKSKT